eukprot:scaffold40027_cov23-Tisochrysis_lutea.AAC.3
MSLYANLCTRALCEHQLLRTSWQAEPSCAPCHPIHSPPPTHLHMHARKHAGDWHADMKSGNGTMHYANGNQYDGEWSQDVKCGYGIMEWKTLRQRYEGLWARNKPNGEQEGLRAAISRACESSNRVLARTCFVLLGAGAEAAPMAHGAGGKASIAHQKNVFVVLQSIRRQWVIAFSLEVDCESTSMPAQTLQEKCALAPTSLV